MKWYRKYPQTYFLIFCPLRFYNKNVILTMVSESSKLLILLEASHGKIWTQTIYKLLLLFFQGYFLFFGSVRSTVKQKNPSQIPVSHFWIVFLEWLIICSLPLELEVDWHTKWMLRITTFTWYHWFFLDHSLE